MKNENSNNENTAGGCTVLPAVPVRVQRSRKHKQVSPNGLPIVYVGRPGKWGNPYKVTGEPGHWFVIDTVLDEPCASFAEKSLAFDLALVLYKEEISHKHNSGNLNVYDLKGKNLSCWCKAGDPCHADVLLELANG